VGGRGRAGVEGEEEEEEEEDVNFAFVRFGVPVYPQFTRNMAKVDARASANRDGNNRAEVHADNGTRVGARARASEQPYGDYRCN
jgi:hypothetical protein